jgi:hypothetical protein
MLMRRLIVVAGGSLVDSLGWGERCGLGEHRTEVTEVTEGV